jgi:hypothetical protein
MHFFSDIIAMAAHIQQRIWLLKVISSETLEHLLSAHREHRPVAPAPEA